MSKSRRLFDKAKQIIPSGVNSPVRYFEPYPFFVKRAHRGNLWDADGNKYVDFCNSYGALLLGHGRTEIMSAVGRQLKNGTMFGAPTDMETNLATLIKQRFPSMEKIRLVNTGGEATMTAIRLARGYTKKSKIIKFEGCYHGAHDSVLVKSGSGHANIGIPVSLGVPNDTAKNTLVVPYNDVEQLERAIKKNNDIACVIIEPILANMGLILPEKNFLNMVRKITRDNDIVLIFDEIITGFRVSSGGAQQLFNIRPDITTLGKALGNGFAISAVGGKHTIMDMLAPSGKVYEASTFAGNPVSVSAAIASIGIMNKMGDRLYTELNKKCSILSHTLDDLANDLKIPHQVNSIQSLFQIFFTNYSVRDYTSAMLSDHTRFNVFFSSLLKNGLFIAPSQFEVSFLSSAHTQLDMNIATTAFETALRACHD